MKILVTGCLGFIGSHFVKYTLKHFSDVNIVGFARNSSTKNLQRLPPGVYQPHEQNRFELIYGDLSRDISGLLEGIDIVINFGAKTFVDHSIKDPLPFIQSNIIGTYNLLEEARRYRLKLFIQISTDEVYGSILYGAHNEESPLNPTNPYSASKAAADMLVIAYGNTYDIPFLITRTENNYGSFQHPQKVIPTFVKKAMAGECLPIYGDGQHRRMWLRVEDHCAAIWHLIKGEYRGIYHVAGEEELSNIQLAEIILEALEKPLDQIEFIDDTKIRPGHDRRYAIDATKLRNTGWRPKYLRSGIQEAAQWYLRNPNWLS